MERATVNGVGLGYDFVGHGTRNVALLNGIAMTTSHWMPVAIAMTGEFRCLLHDFRGQLRSDKPPGPYTLEQHADDFAALLDHLHIEATDIVGTSYGGEIGMIMAYRHPDRVRRLMIVDAVSETDPVLCGAVTAWKAAALADPVVYYRSLTPWNYSPRYLSVHAEELRDRESRIAELPDDYFVAFAELCDAFLAIDITRHLSEIRCPTLIVVADRDILKPRRFSDLIHERIEGSRLVIVEGAGHAVVIEQPERIAGLAREFFTDDNS